MQYAIEGFLGIQRMTLGYTKKDRLFSISLVSEDDHCSGFESDARVSKLMQLCDECYDGIDWNIGKQEHDGRKFAVGQIKYINEKPVDMMFYIVPTRERSIVGLRVVLLDNRRRRMESDYLDFDVRKSLKITDSQYNNANQWLRQQLHSSLLICGDIYRDYNEDGLYRYYCEFERSLYDDDRKICIRLDNGVLMLGGEMSIDEDYAEKLIKARIIVMNKKFAGIDGEIRDCRLGPIVLPCPLCHGKSRNSRNDTCRECLPREGTFGWAAAPQKSLGRISISRKDFNEKFEAYKEYYTTRCEPSGWRIEEPEQEAKRSRIERPPLLQKQERAAWQSERPRPHRLGEPIIRHLKGSNPNIRQLKGPSNRRSNRR